MTYRTTLTTALVTAGLFLAAAPAGAVNLIVNGSFETGNLSGFTHLNGVVSDNSPAVVIAYNQGTSYPTGAYGEAVPTADAATLSPDAAGGYAAYFSSDHANNESLQQLTYLSVGNYELGFSAYLTHNGFANPVDATLDATIIGDSVVSFNAGSQVAGVWKNYNGVGHISAAGYYNTAFVFNSNGYPAKDFVIDQVYASPTTRTATVDIPPNPTLVPEPAAWALMLAGLGGLGAVVRGRRGRAASAA